MGYRGLVEKQNQARDLRAQGWTLSEICEEVGCSKASASLWCRDVEIEEEVLAQRRRARFLAGNEGAQSRGPNKLQRRKAEEILAMRQWDPMGCATVVYSCSRTHRAIVGLMTALLSSSLRPEANEVAGQSFPG